MLCNKNAKRAKVAVQQQPADTVNKCELMLFLVHHEGTANLREGCEGGKQGELIRNHLDKKGDYTKLRVI